MTAAYIARLIGEPALEELLARFSLAGGGFASPPIIDYATAWKLLNAHVETIGDEGHRLSGSAIPNGNFELLVASMLQGISLADGVSRMAAGARILRPDLSFQVSMRRGRLQLKVSFSAGETLAQAIYLEALVTVIHCALRWALEREVEPVRIRGPSIVDPSEGSWLRLFGAPVERRGEGVSLVYPADVSAAPFRQHAFGRWHEAAFNEYLRLAARLEERRGVEDPSTVRQVREALLNGVRGQAEIARALAMSVPSLRRRLTEEGASFRAIQATLQRDAAEVLLLGDKSMEEVATELGLSDARCFRRACRSWFGASPSAVRQALRLAARAPQPASP